MPADFLTREQKLSYGRYQAGVLAKKNRNSHSLMIACANTQIQPVGCALDFSICLKTISGFKPSAAPM